MIRSAAAPPFVINDIDDEEHEEDEDTLKERMEEANVDRKQVRFEDFSPPRMPKNSPSYLIWSIFTREREERKKQLQHVRSN